MPEGLEFLGLELLVQCDSCGATVPLDGPSAEVVCGTCGHATAVDGRAWTAVLSGAAHDFETLGRGVLEPGKLDRPGRDVEWARGPDRPPCLECASPIAAPMPGETPTCHACGARRELEPPLDVMRGADDRILGVVRDPPPPPPRTHTLALPCQSCGAGLETDGSSRMVACPYCSASNVLPDDVWRSLHPPPRRRRFWLHYQLTADPRVPQPDLGAALRLQLFWSAVFAAFVGFIGAGVTASVKLGKSSVSESEMTPYLLPWIGSVFVPLALVLLAGYLARRRLIRAEYEAVGRLGARDGTRVPVDVVRPEHPETVVATTTLSLPGRIYDRLGGEGGLVRAWVTPDGRRVEARPRPSGLG